MPRWIAAAAAVLLLTVGIVVWRMGGGANAAEPSLPAAPPPVQAATLTAGDAPPFVAPAGRERPAAQRAATRLARYDKNDDNRVSLDEYLANRRRSFDRQDTDGDGKLSFAEYTAKTSAKFAEADAGGKGYLTSAEFATTAPKRRPQVECPPTAQAEAD